MAIVSLEPQMGCHREFSGIRVASIDALNRGLFDKIVSARWKYSWTCSAVNCISAVVLLFVRNTESSRAATGVKVKSEVKGIKGPAFSFNNVRVKLNDEHLKIKKCLQNRPAGRGRRLFPFTFSELKVKFLFLAYNFSCRFRARYL